MKKSIITTILILITLNNILLAQGVRKDYSHLTPKLNDNNYYRSIENKYRIQLPSKWIINKGNSLGAEFNAKSDYGDATMSVIINTLNDKADFSAHDIPVETLMSMLRKNIPSVSLLESKKIYVANKKSMFLKYKFNYKSVDNDVNVICEQYSFNTETLAFTITFQTLDKYYDEYASIFKKCISTFTFEDFD